jgi:23S rRNA (adenine2503-C2)-methyltransferase
MTHIGIQSYNSLLLAAGVNDSYHDAKELAELLYQWKLAHHVNVIPYNPVEDSEFKRPDRAAVREPHV